MKSKNRFLLALFELSKIKYMFSFNSLGILRTSELIEQSSTNLFSSFPRKCLDDVVGKSDSEEPVGSSVSCDKSDYF